jgi:hypothetical protein
LFPVGLILLQFLVLWLYVGFCWFGSILHALGNLSGLSSWLLLGSCCSCVSSTLISSIRSILSWWVSCSSSWGLCHLLLLWLSYWLLSSLLGCICIVHLFFEILNK